MKKYLFRMVPMKQFIFHIFSSVRPYRWYCKQKDFKLYMVLRTIGQLILPFKWVGTNGYINQV